MWKRVFGLAFVVAAACACPSKPSTAGPTVGSDLHGSGSAQGSGSGGPVVATDGKSCDGIRAKVEALYRDEAQRKEPKRVDEMVADNTAMAMKDCAKEPTRVAPCIAAAQSVADLEKTCLAPLDPEGTEGDTLGKHK